MVLVSLLNFKDSSDTLHDVKNLYNNYWKYYNTKPKLSEPGVAYFPGNSIILFNTNRNSIIKRGLFNNSPFVIDFKFKLVDTSGNTLVYRTSDNSELFHYWGGNYNSTISGYSIGRTRNVWFRYTETFDPSSNPSVKLYENGKVIASANRSSYTPGFYIGGNDTWKGGNYLVMYSQPIAIFQGTLPVTEFDYNTNFLIEYYSLLEKENSMYGILKND